MTSSDLESRRILPRNEALPALRDFLIWLSVAFAGFLFAANSFGSCGPTDAGMIAFFCFLIGSVGTLIEGCVLVAKAWGQFVSKGTG